MSTVVPPHPPQEENALVKTGGDSLLARVDSPEDLRRLSEEDLPRLAEEVRKFTIASVAETGGHLGASLGVVELTTAIHYVFDTPHDRLIWDVGHQSYPHKILTGRKNQMGGLRTQGGISGFTKRDESPYDPFGAGHSSTSISAALGMALAARAKGEKRRAIAVIGDGALSAGLAFEALNNAGHEDPKNLIVILNDNEMSISKNVGALSNYLSRILSGRVYSKFRNGAETVLEKISPDLKEAARRAEGHVKGMFTPGTLFEELGFTYFGPVDGHDFNQLIPTLQNIKRLESPILLHVVTRKGKGYAPAEHNPCTYHGVRPFDPATGEIAKERNPAPSFTKVFAERLTELAHADQRINAITAAMPEGTGLNLFEQRFPGRFFDVGIAEQHAVTFAAGLAAEGLIPVVAIYSTFLQRAYDQIIHDVALQGLPVVFALDRGGLVGADGATHAGAYDMAFLRTVPGLSLMAPADENELRNMLTAAVALGKPVALRYPRGKALGLPEEEIAPTPYGVGRKLRDGKEASIAAVGSMVHPALAAAEILAEEGIHAAVYDMRWIKPLDENMLREAAAAPFLLTVEEGTVCGGFGSGVLEFLAADGLLGNGLTAKIAGIPDRYIPHGSPRDLLAELGLSAEGIAAAVRDGVKGT